MPVLLFPFSFLTPLATLLMPEVTEAHILGRQKTLETLVGRIMLFTTTFSVLAGGLIALYAYPLGRLLYHDETIGFYLAVLAPVLPGMYLDAMGDSILKGLGEEVATFRYSIWDSLIRIGLVILLMPRMGMKGFSVCDDLFQRTVRTAEYLPHREGGPHPHPLVPVVCAACADLSDIGGSGAGGPAPDGREWRLAAAAAGLHGHRRVLLPFDAAFWPVGCGAGHSGPAKACRRRRLNLWAFCLYKQLILWYSV